MTIRCAVFDRDVSALDDADLAQTLLEGGHIVQRLPRPLVQKSNHRKGPLCGRCGRPCECRTSEQGNELTSPHSITSSARCRRNQGTSSPSAFAVLRLITSSNLTGA